MSFLLQPFYDIKEIWKDSTPLFQKSFFYFLGTFFLILGTYPMIRTTTTSIYMNFYGGAKTPTVWFYSIVVLSITIFIYNKLYKIFKIQTLFLMTSLLSMIFFVVGTLLVSRLNWLSYLLFIWKEVYIVLLINLALGYLNESINVAFAKLFYGLVGAVGSIGGILGGVLVHYLTYSFSTEQILIMSSGPLLLGVMSFWSVRFPEVKKSTDDSKVKLSPLKSIRNVKKYVGLFVILLVLTQVVISLANFKFNILFDQLVPDKGDKTRFLSTLYSLVNGFALVIQIMVIPYLFKFVSIRKIHLLIPLFYLSIITVGFFLFGTLFSVAAVFTMLKGSDYSIFNAAKELLFFPLEKIQKTGAKYLVDMVAYRGAKGLISFILIYVQSDKFITVGLFSALFCWIILLIPLLRERQNLLNKKDV